MQPDATRFATRALPRALRAACPRQDPEKTKRQAITAPAEYRGHRTLVAGTLSMLGSFTFGLSVGASTASAATLSSASVSSDSKTVYAISHGERVELLRACKNELFFSLRGLGETSPSLSPDGHWLLVERVYPFELKGRVDESTVLVDIARHRSYSSSVYGRRLGIGDLIDTSWKNGEAATLHLEGAAKTLDVKLPGALASLPASNRCP